MTVEVVDIHNTIAKGLQNAWHNHFFMTEERYEKIKPEYLTTAAVCYAFSDFISTNNLLGCLTVRAEEQTKSLWVKTLIPLFMRIGNRQGHKRESEIRKGNVDISLAFRGNSVCETPFGIIENKGFLKFTNDNTLYAGSKGEVEKDLKRNIEFVSGFNGEGIEYAGFTFYLRDECSVLKSEGATYCQDKKQYFSEFCNNLIPSSSCLKFEVAIETLESNLFNSLTEAEYQDENGYPAYISDGTWNIVYGIISIYRVGKAITHDKLF